MTIDEINIPQATSSEFQLTSKATGTTYPLLDEVLVGRELDCTIRLQDPQIRRYHAKVSASEDGLFLEDLNSKNNTYLNGCRIGTGAWVTLSDEINFDGVKFTVEAVSLPNEEPVEHINIEDTLGFGTPFSKPAAAPEMPFSNQDVVEATRALEERAKARLQLFKESEESGLNPDWEEFIANRNKKALSEPSPVKPLVFPIQAGNSTPASQSNSGEQKTAVITPISSRQSTTPSRSADEELAELEREIAALTDEPLIDEAPADSVQESQNIQENALIDENIEENLIDPPETIEAPQSPLEQEDRSVGTSAKRSSSAVNLGSGPRLLAQTAPIRGKCYLLAATDAKKTWTIGRANNTDMQLSEDAIDLVHAHIELSDTGYKIRTTRTTNGMLINGKFNAEATLKHNDTIQFGRIEFIYRDDEIAVQPTKASKPRKINYSLIAGALVVLGALLTALLNSPIPL